METVDEARATILRELTSEDPEVRESFVKHFRNDIEQFSNAMAEAFVRWRSFDSGVGSDEKQAYVSALMFTAITLHILSMKLFISGYLVAAGNLFRQVVEIVALTILCSSDQTDVLARFMARSYSTHVAVRDMNRLEGRLGLNKEALRALEAAQTFYHEYSHPTILTIAAGISFSEKGSYVGASFDQGKLDVYAKEIAGRVGLATVFLNFIDGVRTNVAKWKRGPGASTPPSH